MTRQRCSRSANPLSEVLSLVMNLKFPGLHPLATRKNLLLWLGSGCPIANEIRYPNGTRSKARFPGDIGLAHLTAAGRRFLDHE